MTRISGIWRGDRRWFTGFSVGGDVDGSRSVEISTGGDVVESRDSVDRVDWSKG